jgi:hypothetical protein
MSNALEEDKKKIGSQFLAAEAKAKDGYDLIVSSQAD